MDGQKDVQSDRGTEGQTYGHTHKSNFIGRSQLSSSVKKKKKKKKKPASKLQCVSKL